MLSELWGAASELELSPHLLAEPKVEGYRPTGEAEMFYLAHGVQNVSFTRCVIRI